MTLRNIEALFHSNKVSVLGKPETISQHQLLTNIQASIGADRCPVVTARAALLRLPDNTELAVVNDARWARPRLIRGMGEKGYRAILWAAETPISDAALRAARPYNLRLLGNRTTGVFNIRRSFNPSTLALAPRAGRVALITQSRSIMAAALDWAHGRNIGFSWLACTGTEADIDAADLLDYAALDPTTRAVVLEINRIGSPRKFMSAARSAARVKPVLVLQTRTRDPGNALGPDPARSAAFARAGLVECENLGGLFDGLVALDLLRSVNDNRVLVVGNGAGVCALGADALERQNLVPSKPAADTVENLSDAAPKASAISTGIDLQDSDIDATMTVIDAALADSNIDAVLLVYSPMPGQPHKPLVEAIAQTGARRRLLTVWLGLHTALPARHESAHARLATFASIDEAVRAVRYRAQYRRTRELLSATPPPDPSVTADIGSLQRRLAILAADNVRWLPTDECELVLTAYGLTGEQPIAPAFTLRFRAIRHPELGMILAVRGTASGLDESYSLPPLDMLLAQRLLEDARIGGIDAVPGAMGTLGRALNRLGRMIVDLWHVTQIDLGLAVDARGSLLAPLDSVIEITRDPVPERERLAITPYPARMRHRVTLGPGRPYVVRAIQPSDEPAVLRLLESLDAEQIQLRFFAYIRRFTHDMAARMTQVDYDREISLVVAPANAPDTLAGMATLIAGPDRQQAEFALLVHRDHGRIGLGRHLLDCLLRQAGAHGINQVYGDILAHNQPMCALVRSLGFSIMHTPEEPTTVRATIQVNEYRREKQ